MTQKLTTNNMTLCAMFSALIAIGAFIQIPVPFFDYFTLQYFFVLLAGMLLGSKLGALAVFLYVILGLLGLPIFAAGGGPAYIVRPSFGYLIGFIFAAYGTGLVCEKARVRTIYTYALAVIVGLCSTYVLGLSYKYMILNYYTGTPISWKVLLLSIFPIDLPGDICLSVLAMLLGKKIKTIVELRYTHDK